MTDRELLELAAKAAGIGPLDFDYAERESHGMYFGPRLPMPQGVLMAAMHTYWNPLADDGDALRLAVKLGLVLNLSPREDCRGQTVVTYHGCCKVEEPCHEGRDVAARRAIVLAAAQIAKLSAQTAGQREEG